jgi:CrcB protein
VTIPQVQAFAIFTGGALGTVVRAALGEVLPREPGQWPWATFTVNLAGAFVLAWASTRLTEVVAPTRYLRFLVGVGFCGALTTFSTLQVETIELARDGHPVVAIGYVAASLTAGMLAAAGATIIARRRRYG